MDAILFVLTDAAAALSCYTFGSRPPMVAWDGEEWSPCHGDGWEHRTKRAIVLAWDGEPVCLGCDAALRVAGRRPFGSYGDMTAVLEIGASLQRAGVGRVVTLDGGGR
jgi:hypothetical protein